MRATLAFNGLNPLILDFLTKMNLIATEIIEHLGKTINVCNFIILPEMRL